MPFYNICWGSDYSSRVKRLETLQTAEPRQTSDLLTAEV